MTKQIINVYLKDKKILIKENELKPRPGSFLIFERKIREIEEIQEQTHAFEISRVIYFNFDMIKDLILFYEKYSKFKEVEKSLNDKDLKKYIKENFNFSSKEEINKYISNIKGLDKNLLDIYIDFKDFKREV